MTGCISPDSLRADAKWDKMCIGLTGENSTSVKGEGTRGTKPWSFIIRLQGTHTLGNNQSTLFIFVGIVHHSSVSFKYHNQCTCHRPSLHSDIFPPVKSFATKLPPCTMDSLCPPTNWAGTSVLAKL